jgi:hypothetical protein
VAPFGGPAASSVGRPMGFAPPPRGGFAVIVDGPHLRTYSAHGTGEWGKGVKNGASPSPYSAECVEGEFSEVRVKVVLRN